MRCNVQAMRCEVICKNCKKNISNNMKLRRHLTAAQSVFWHKFNLINRSYLRLGRMK